MRRVRFIKAISSSSSVIACNTFLLPMVLFIVPVRLFFNTRIFSWISMGSSDLDTWCSSKLERDKKKEKKEEKAYLDQGT